MTKAAGRINAKANWETSINRSRFDTEQASRAHPDGDGAVCAEEATEIIAQLHRILHKGVLNLKITPSCI